MPLKAIDSSKPVLGYKLKERIGAGGYGEVWVAEAPGGMSKAVKFIFGYHDESRAQDELKSLNRIKEVRHPFLLSLERIDVVDGQMVVITELADMSLKDRFRECQESGLKGIPRVELFGFMRDAADALDYISQVHSLQHLDVKPENLLLVSGHVKVADYGLVKDIHDGTQSLMSGLTPAFAPPELFDGRPSKSSDQYSLAIVYQEMLTGVRPFDGMTAAQLASQHMNDRPNLKSLPREDQSVISRALSKDPELRYPSCRSMIDELTDKTNRMQTRQRKSLKQKPRRPEHFNTHSEATMLLPDGARPVASRPAEVKFLEPIAVDPSTAKARPTLFLGIGNTGTQICRSIRRRLLERIGPKTSTPAIAVLCLDTDQRDLAEAAKGKAAHSLDRHETIELPLRRPDEYRADKQSHLNWLSRRWIYNVPRSLQTEGIRPLGRLAFADNHEQLFIRLRQILSNLVRPELLADTADTLGMDPLDHPRVFIVGSVSGGACSGMAIDTAYAVRAILSELGASDDDVIGVFTHSTVKARPERQLMVANTIAFLSELYHFSCVEEYPGDETCGIPSFLDDRPTFGSTYLTHLGGDLLQEEFELRTEAIAEYLYLGTATPCAAFFDLCRSTEPETTGLALRSLGLSRTAGPRSDVVANATSLLGKRLIDMWCNGASTEFAFDAGEFAEQHLNSLKINTQSWVQQVHRVMSQVHADPTSELAGLLSRAMSTGPAQPSDLQVIAEDFLVEEKLESLVDEWISTQLQEKQTKFVEPLLSLIDLPRVRIAGVRRTINQLDRILSEQIAQLDALAEQANECRIRLGVQMIRKDASNDLAVFCTENAETFLQSFTVNAVQRAMSAVKSLLKFVACEVDARQSKLELLVERTLQKKPNNYTEQLSPTLQFESRLLNQLNDRLDKLVDRVEQQLQQNVLEPNHGLRAVLADDDGNDLFADGLAEAARTTVIEDLKETDVDQFLRGDDAIEHEVLVDWMQAESSPRLLEAGGSTRVLLALPARAKSEILPGQVQAQFKQAPSVVSATAGDVVACYEVESIPLDNVAMMLLRDCPDSIDFASRLHTRNDVSWCALTSIQ